VVGPVAAVSLAIFGLECSWAGELEWDSIFVTTAFVFGLSMVMMNSVLLSTLMHATNTQTATHVSPLKKVTSRADGAKEEHSTIMTMDKPNTNAVVTKMESHSSSPAQEHSRPKIARDTAATGPTTHALSPRKDNSQMRRHASKHANHQSSRYATSKLRNVTTALRAHQDVTPMLIVRLSAMYKWLNATTQLDNARHVTQELTKIAT
jgi:hypothetical protein